MMNDFIADKKIQASIKLLAALLAEHGAELGFTSGKITFTAHHKSISFLLIGGGFDFSKTRSGLIMAIDQLVTAPEKISGIVLSKLKLNSIIFARRCEVKKINKEIAEKFLEDYHLMNSTQNAFNLGLFYKNELVAVASFSKGRKMDRLPEHKRSFELIRFCCKPGATITGGLTKLLKHFCFEKDAGDIMTYVDKQLSDGGSFVCAGFKICGETAPNYFLVNKTSFERMPLKNKAENFDTQQFYLFQNSGNIKMIYQPAA